jgi:hypothetical protein
MEDYQVICGLIYLFGAPSLFMFWVVRGVEAECQEIISEGSLDK